MICCTPAALAASNTFLCAFWRFSPTKGIEIKKEKNQRQDRLHKLTTKLVRDFDVIVLEDLQTANLMKNHQLDRSIAAQSWREIRSQLAYKCVKYGKELPIQDLSNLLQLWL